ncbi:MAG: 3'(2'),5'-bisphosphate nucleotidase [SAR86 cluster bacterium]|uniref:3'(2'),5'-bisphosphate nucleotidase CysQ n=1 Tax=SAR86 cluster bacterium TaxID=2030880 RepID=A0A2A4X830_9GAMM|nr:MAG: 3'(2'),5'-bisphosphate nucleotidase [SAR86 cluster bacterium]
MLDLQLLNAVNQIAIAAGSEILAVYNSEHAIEVSTKQDDSPLTDADRRAHCLIVDRLSSLTPDIPLLSEESDAIDYGLRKSWQRYWLIDPLDGTKEFINRNGEFTVNIALIENGESVAGVVHVPVTGISYFGGIGIGAWKQETNCLDSEAKSIISRPMQENSCVRIVASRRHLGEQLDALVGKIENHFGKATLLSMGSSLKMCLLAEGNADIYPRMAPTCEWDTAAAHGILSAAGGEIVDLQFRPLRYNSKPELLNPFFIALADRAYPWQQLLDKQ